MIPGAQLPCQQPLGQRILHQRADRPAQRPRSVGALFGILHNPLDQGILEYYLNFLLLQTGGNGIQQLSGDLPQLPLLQRLEQHRFIQTPQKFRSEMLPQFGQHRFLCVGAGITKAHCPGMQQMLRPQVGGQDHHRIAEDAQPPLAVGQPAVLHDLQEQIEQVGMGFLDLVEHHHTHGMLFDRLGQHAALLAAHITGRRAEQPGNAVRFAVFAHVQLDDILFAAEERFAQRIAQLGLAHAAGAEEQKAADGAPGVTQAGAASQDGMRHGIHRLLLPHHALPQPLLQPFGRKLLCPRRQSGHGSGCRLHLPEGQSGPAAGFPPRSPAGGSAAQTVDPHAGRRFIQQVQRLIRQETGGKIAHREPDRSLQRFLRDEQPVMLFVARTQSPQNRHRLLLAGFFHQNALEPPGQRAVLFDGLAIFRNGGGADHLQIAAGQSGLHDIGGIHRPLRRTDPHDGVDLIDKQDHIPGRCYFLHHRPDSLFKVPAVLGPGHHRRQIQRDDPLFRQGKRHPSFRDPLCQPFDDGGLTHPRFPDQAGVIFGAAGKDLQQPFGFLFPADDRVQPALPGLFGQIPAEAVQHDAAGLLLRPAHHTRGLPVAVLLALFQADGFPQGGRQRRHIDRKPA